MGHKRQHWVPRSYLASWCDPDTPPGQEPYVWLFQKDGTNVKRRAPDNIFHETDLYTIDVGGQRDLTLEHGLSTVESQFVRIRNEVLRRRQPLNDEDRVWLLIFVAAAVSRTRAMRDHMREQWTGMLQKMDRLQEHIDRATPKQLERMIAAAPPVSDNKDSSISHEAVKAMAETPLQIALPGMISSQLRIFRRMKLGILFHDFKPGFITSDTPCVWFDPESYKYPVLFRSPGLGMASIEVTLPISPRQMVIISHQDNLEGYIPLYRSTVVDELNRRTRFHCDEYLVVSRNETRPVWFEEREPPDTSSAPSTQH